MHTIRVLIVDDEQPARGTIRLILKQIGNVEVVGECANGDECLRFVSEHGDIDIIFLDIEMPGISGLQAASSIRLTNPNIHIVFSTGYSQFAIEAFDLEAFDYVLKPYRKARILQTINRYLAMIEVQETKENKELTIAPQNRKLVVRMDEKYKLLDAEKEIVFISNEKAGGTRFFTTDGITESKTPLKDFEDSIPTSCFIRSHRCYLVNINFIRDIIPWFNDTYMLKMKGYEDYQVPVSRTYLKCFKQALGI